MRKLLVLLVGISFNVAAANNDDGFVWVDANTKIKLKPIGSTAGSAATGRSAAPEQAKKAKAKKKAEK